MTESESGVLPLHYTSKWQRWNYNILLLNIQVLICFLYKKVSFFCKNVLFFCVFAYFLDIDTKILYSYVRNFFTTEDSVKKHTIQIVLPSKFADGIILRWLKSPFTPVQATQVIRWFLINYLLPERLWWLKWENKIL